MASFIRIKLAGAGAFGEVSILEDDTIARVAGRACAKFPSWRADATQLSLYLVAEGGEDTPPPLAEASASYLGETGWSLTRAGISSGAWLVARVSTPTTAPPAPSKKFFLVVSSENERGEVAPVTMDVTISAGSELKDLIKANGGGNLVLVNSTPPYPNLSFKDVVSGSTYTLLGGRQRAYLDKQNWTQQADKMLEEVSTLAVRDACGESLGALRMLLDTKVKNSKGEERQFDGLLLTSATAIAVEAKHVAMEEHIDIVLSGAAFLKKCAQESSDERFSGITEVLPVLAANRFSDAMAALCRERGIGVVKHNGSCLTYIPAPQRTLQLGQRSPPSLPARRSFHTLASALRALL